jgi:porin
MKTCIALFFLMLFIWDIGFNEEKTDFHKALQVNFLYTGEELANLSGGIKKGQVYRGDFNVFISVYTEKAGLWKGGELFLNFENGHGRGITDRNVGALHELSNIEAHDFTQISQYYIEQSLFGDKIHITLGKQDSNADFAVTESALKFLNASFALMPNIPLPTFPDPSLGISVESILSKEITVRAGIFDGNGSGGSWGFSTAFGTGAVSVSVMEIEKEYNLFAKGKAKFGVWRHGGKFPSLNDSSRVKSFNDGGYIILEQGIIGSEKESRNAVIFVNYGYAPDEYTQISEFFVLGMKLSGFLFSRSQDSMGIGLAREGISNTLAGLENETAFEMYYLLSVNGNLSLQPDVQYIWNPGGIYPDALAGGIRFRVNF